MHVSAMNNDLHFFVCLDVVYCNYNVIKKCLQYSSNYNFLNACIVQVNHVCYVYMHVDLCRCYMRMTWFYSNDLMEIRDALTANLCKVQSRLRPTQIQKKLSSCFYSFLLCLYTLMSFLLLSLSSCCEMKCYIGYK